MGLYIEENVLIIIEPKTFNLDLPKDVNKNLKHKINFYHKTQ